MKVRHVDGQWTDFPDPPVENAVWDWLSSIQDNYFADTPGRYYIASTPADLTGAEARRQLDLLVKRRTDTADMTHDWKDVYVVGDHASNRD